MLSVAEASVNVCYGGRIQILRVAQNDKDRISQSSPKVGTTIGKPTLNFEP